MANNNAATLVFGFDGVQVEQGLNRLSQRTTQFGTQVEASGRKLSGAAAGLDRVGKGGAFQRGLGGASAQLQDIAVQLQGGTSALTVFTQQGSQLAGAFGTKGAIIGGVIAIGGALLSMGQAGNEAFAEMAQEVEAAEKATASLAGSAGIGAVVSTLDKVIAAQKTVIAQQDKSNTFFGKIGEIGGDFLAPFTGAPLSDEKKVERELSKDRLARAETKLNKNAIAEAKALTEIAKLKEEAAGEDKAAAAFAKDKLAAIERARDLEREIASIKDSSLKSDTQEILIKEAQARFSLGNPNANTTAAQREVQKKQESQLKSTRSIEENLQVKELRAAGKNTAADKLQKQFDLRDRAAEISRTTGATPAAAAEFAKREQLAEDKLADRAGGRRKIRGGVSSSTFEGLDGRKFPGLDRLQSLQARDYLGNRSIPLGQAFQRQNATNAKLQQAKENKLVPEAAGMLSTLQAIEKHLSSVN
jgi:hypothetical protein